MVQIIWLAILGGIANAAVIPPFVDTGDDPTPTRRIKQSNQGLEIRQFLESPSLDNSQIYLPGASGDWLTVSCEDKAVTNANDPDMKARYEAAKVPDAWKQVTKAWLANLATPSPGTVQVQTFDLFLSNAFKTPEGRVCQLHSTSCNTVSCNSNGQAPAVYLILNSISYVEKFFTFIYDCFSEAVDEISAGLSYFVAVFAPITKNDKAIAQVMLELFLFASLALIPSGFGGFAAIGAISSKLGLVIATFTGNVLVSGAVYAHNMIGNNLKESETLVDKEYSLDKLIKNYILDIKEGLKKALASLMNPRYKETIDQLGRYVVDGSMNSQWSLIKQNRETDAAEAIKSAAKKTLYASLLPAAWTTNDKNNHPFLLRVPTKDYKCNSTLEEKKGMHFKLTLGTYMPDSVREKSISCSKEKDENGESRYSWFLLTANTEKSLCSGSVALGCQHTNDKWWAFLGPPGGDAWTLKNMTGITIEDIVTAQWAGFKLNGMKNGYKPPEDSTKVANDDGTIGKTNIDLPLSAGIRIPGAFGNIPICLDYQAAASNIASQKWFDGSPCGDESELAYKSDPVPVIDTVKSVIDGVLVALPDSIKAKESKSNEPATKTTEKEQPTTTEVNVAGFGLNAAIEAVKAAASSIKAKETASTTST